AESYRLQSVRRGCTKPSRDGLRSNRGPQNELASSGCKSRIFIDRPTVYARRRGRSDRGLRRSAPMFSAIGAGTRMPRSALTVAVNHFARVALSLIPSTVEDRMYDVAEKMARLRRLRNAAMVAVVLPAALLAAGCSQPAPPPPPPPAPVAAPPPPPPPPPVRG